MIVLLRHVLGWLLGVFQSHRDLLLENLALRQQLLVLHAQRPLSFIKTSYTCKINEMR